MKKLLIFITALVMSVTAYSQTPMGIKGGVNFANQKWDGGSFTISPESRTGFHFGAFAEFVANESVSIQPELLFSTMGAKVDLGFGETESRLNYLTIPVMAKLNFMEMLNIHAGPQVGFLFSAKNQDDEELEDLGSLDFGVAFGGGLSMTNGAVAGIRYYLGLANIYDGSGDDEIRNTNFQIYLGWKFQ